MNDRHQFISGLLLLLATLGYGVFQWTGREALLIQAEALRSEVANLTSISKKLTDEYQVIKAQVTTNRETTIQELSLVFPTSEDITALTRLLDDFAVKNNFANSPFFISGITYEEAKSSSNLAYQYVTLHLSITTSKKNLGKFLEFIDTSGSLEGEIRLMSISDIGLTYPDAFGEPYEADITVRAYFSQDI